MIDLALFEVEIRLSPDCSWTFRRRSTLVEGYLTASETTVVIEGLTFLGVNREDKQEQCKGEEHLRVFINACCE